MRQKPEAICTVALIVINIAVFFILTMFGDTEDAVFMLQHGAMYEPNIIEGHEYYRIFTCLFLHFGITHLLNNMVLLGALGWNLELEIGKVRFVIIYFASGIIGNIVSLFYDLTLEQPAVSAGASGAIFGLMGALLYVVIANRGRLGRLSGRGMLVMVILSLYFGLTSTGVDNLAHIGGLVSGFLLAVLLYRRKQY
ncbi:rhomboid family intramembrane serine protease [Mediterraneibacter glycyrrhizinilyticus]|uniref:Rhomboid family intramembrane serine protease n=1 Tax=Candidatus Mediterraneibacter faecipullorum TaxID=2838670 RepID=A0A9D2NMK1_9FIRM|nr:rhomboid family intramembrane serine protease [Mediterraneibacter glycyrrhizinilyticus]MBM6804092.1 rhomboid family intramembrane serine protease [Mediterraneibacter glycyrrhizinilyticus]MDM8126313.1 rhomboid family intramembrane serine protease [Mediterraneibacter glycyrrhizinilyticus]MDM8211700.1 rhomboid family intramembrane serine protease [Mediterraneibacter glycyrrhizinilyticus]HJC35027.1 rhomboid family intramembrane serine protease [Candidatus Mediterraneibacter faecipullorum]